jgi:uncharacterized membrane protein YhaH (DUF805 family)
VVVSNEDIMSIDGPRFAAFLAFTERGFTPDEASSCVMALHPLDDAPIPGRQFEKAVRSRSKTFAKDATRTASTVALRLAHEALNEYRLLAFQFGERYYQTRYDQYLPAQPAQAAPGPGHPQHPSAASPTIVASPASPSDVWWGAPSESAPPPPPPPVEASPQPTADGVNASWAYAPPGRPEQARSSAPAAQPMMAPPIAAQRMSPTNVVAGAAPTRSFGEAVAVCLNKYAVFAGRSSRSEYWYFALFTFLASFGAVFLGIALPLGGLGDLFGAIVQLALIVPGIAVGVRRMHDVDRSGWFILVPVYNIVLAASKGTDGSNRFG